MSEVDVKTFATEGNRDLHILYGSQSGNSEGLAEKWQKEANKVWIDSYSTRQWMVLISKSIVWYV